jgi:hypothetical protein
MRHQEAVYPVVDTYTAAQEKDATTRDEGEDVTLRRVAVSGLGRSVQGSGFRF